MRPVALAALALGLWLGAGMTASGVVASTPTPTARTGAPPVWTVNKANSRVRFKSAFSGTSFEGRFERWDARIAFDPKKPSASKAFVTFDLASVTTGDRDRDETLPTADWFDVAKFPRATFTTIAIRRVGGSRYQAIGNLTLKGIVRRVTLPFTLAIQGDTARMNGQLVIDRSHFGIGRGQFADAATVPLDVVVTISITARRAL